MIYKAISEIDNALSGRNMPPNKSETKLEIGFQSQWQMLFIFDCSSLMCLEETSSRLRAGLRDPSSFSVELSREWLLSWANQIDISVLVAGCARITRKKCDMLLTRRRISL